MHIALRGWLAFSHIKASVLHSWKGRAGRSLKGRSIQTPEARERGKDHRVTRSRRRRVSSGTLVFLIGISCRFKGHTYHKGQDLGPGGLNAFFINERLIPIGFFFFFFIVSASPQCLSLTPASASYQLASGGPYLHPYF